MLCCAYQIAMCTVRNRDTTTSTFVRLGRPFFWLNLYGPVIASCTTRFDIHKFYICPHSVLCVLSAVISLYNFNWLVFITEWVCVYCAVRAGYLITFRLIFVEEFRPCHSWASYSPASQRRCLGSVPTHSVWDFWWKKWQWDRVFFKYFGLSLSV